MKHTQRFMFGVGIALAAATFTIENTLLLPFVAGVLIMWGAGGWDD